MIVSICVELESTDIALGPDLCTGKIMWKTGIRSLLAAKSAWQRAHHIELADQRGLALSEQGFSSRMI